VTLLEASRFMVDAIFVFGAFAFDFRTTISSVSVLHYSVGRLDFQCSDSPCNSAERLGAREGSGHPFITSQNKVAPPTRKVRGKGGATTHFGKYGTLDVSTSRTSPRPLLPTIMTRGLGFRRFVFLRLAVMTPSSIFVCDDIVFLQEHFA
jgi:hypothetical protein